MYFVKISSFSIKFFQNDDDILHGNNKYYRKYLNKNRD